jgi:hypothetical protein
MAGPAADLSFSAVHNNLGDRARFAARKHSACKGRSADNASQSRANGFINSHYRSVISCSDLPKNVELAEDRVGQVLSIVRIIRPV